MARASERASRTQRAIDVTDSINWRDEAERLYEALRSLERVGATGHRGGKTLIADACRTYETVKRRQTNRENESRQTSLIDRPDIPSRPSQRQDTSVEAAGAYSAATAQRTRSAVLTQITRRPCTDEEIATALSMEGNSVRPRRIELVERGLVRDSGTRRLTKAKRRAIVWELVRS